MRRSAKAPIAAILILAASLSLGPSTVGAGEAGRPDQRPSYSAGEAAAARPAHLPADVRFRADDVEAYARWAAAAPHAADKPWLVLSGGGENGAYGAGLLTGWTASGARPEFGVVTGVSTGALIAPFAFLGERYDGVLREAYTTISAADVFEFGGKEALTDTWPLRDLIARHITPEIIAEVAAAHRAGRRLVVVTTDIDTQRPVAWDMGAIAASGGERALALFRQVVLASAAIPGLFPSVLIPAEAGDKAFDEMHVDGGTTSPFFIAPAPVVLGAAVTPFPGREVYLVVNGRLTPDFDVTPRTPLGTLGRAMSTAIRAQTAAALALTRAFAERAGFGLHVTTIDDRFAPRSPAPFDQDFMRALFAHGERLGRAGGAFDGRASDDVPTGSLAHQGRRADLR